MRSPFFFFDIVLLPMFVLSLPPAVCAPLSLSIETTFVTTIAGSAGDNGYSDGIGEDAWFWKPFGGDYDLIGKRTASLTDYYREGDVRLGGESYQAYL